MREASLHEQQLQTSIGYSRRTDAIAHVIEHAAHLLPAQGPITVFVHHNTLHAFEDSPFDEAVRKGAKTFGCHPYLPEERYRQEHARGRIRSSDIEAVLIHDLGDDADELLGFLGTRFHLRQAMLQYRLHTGPAVELRWIVEETDALRKFGDEAPEAVRERLIRETRQWYVRDLWNASAARANAGATAADQRVRKLASEVLVRFETSRAKYWTDSTWEALCLHLLWQVCRDGVSRARKIAEPSLSPVRHRDVLLAVTGQDSDELVHGVLIRFCAAFLDQGLAGWTLPAREQGFLRSFIALYADGPASPERWTRGLRTELIRLRQGGLDPLQSIEESLTALGVTRDEEAEFLTQTLLALRGWAGMIWQMESRGDRVAYPAPQGSLVEFLAVRLILERLAVAYVARQSLGDSGPLNELRHTTRRSSSESAAVSIDQRAFLIFQLAQLLGWNPEILYRSSSDVWTWLLKEVESFSGVERRRIYHLAFERGYRIQTLDALTNHTRKNHSKESAASPREPFAGSGSTPAFQVVCCIDEREESFRRHLEEIAPECETFGTAGFFAVAMYYRGAADAHFAPLCPVVVTPRHYVRENVTLPFEQTERQRQARRRTIGTVTHRVHVGSRTFAGGWLAAVLGSLASIPLVMRILFPRLTAQFRRLIGGFVRTPAVTQLQLERTADPAGPEHGHVGYRVDEMADVVERLLRDIGLTDRLARLVVIVGHGSSSLNNPHESAYNCGACGGGSGGPNARAFAQLANDLRVRERLVTRGFPIPTDAVFVGGYHNTCDDSLAWYDLDRLPASHRSDFERAAAALAEAGRHNAHERCRRFASAELDLSVEEAARHVEGRAEDLSQARPECGHATNALCLVGSRDWSRGMFLDRRAFLQSYDPARDDEQRTILTRILQAVIPVCAGINLEYYFSYVDPTGYGCGTKLPHNIVSLLGVMNGAASDLRPGLPWQMVEIHEPVRLLFVIEATPEALHGIMERNPAIARLFRGSWVQLATIDPASSVIRVFREGDFAPYRPESTELPEVAASSDWYRGSRDHLGFARVVGSQRKTAPSGGLDRRNQDVREESKSV